ncbi:MAG: SUMF1/EgtB/PvdO family nonheme iron enzyme [Verrucomicrobiaceae bacterium]|nr:SUMF1/EgtB/PvdO family nonheme iron enzyme [Verrucomicrobiaceae bacterium]
MKASTPPLPGLPTRLLWLAFLVGTPAVAAEDQVAPPAGMLSVPGGSYTPLYSKEAQPRKVAPFFLDETLVTNREFLAFVEEHPEWRRSAMEPTRADAMYLSHWRGDLDPGDEALLESPVTHISWFAAKAYCEARGKRLPTQDEWEFVALADATRPDASKDQEFLKKLLQWYSQPSGGLLPSAAAAEPNFHGVRGLHGLVWEWVQDFNSSMVVGDSRGDGALERRLFCGGDSLFASDVSNYAAFMRYAFRSSLKGTYCVGSLGFRGARSLVPDREATPSRSFSTLYELPGIWRTQDGEAVSLTQLRGKPRVVTLGFTRCEYSCPRIFADMQRIESALGPDASGVGFTFFSIDPLHDTPEAMTKKMADLKMDPSRWTFLTAPDDDARELAVVLDFKFQQVQDAFAHSNLIAVLDANGNLVHREDSLGADIAPTVEALRKLLAP